MPTLTGCSVCFKRALAIAKSFSRGSASIEIAAEFFWVSVMVVFMVACGWQKIYTVLQRTSTSDLGAHYLLPARSTSGISPVSAWMVIGPHIGFVLLDEILDVMSLPGTGGRGAAPVRTMEKASTGVASSTCAPNQNLQTSGVTNVVSSHAMTAIPLPMER